MKRISGGVLCTVAVAALLAVPGAQATSYRLDYEVQPQIVGVTSSTPTGTIYDAGSFYSGVVELLITDSGGAFRCSGALISGGWTVLTAGHCLADADGNLDTTRVRVVFHGDSGGTVVYDSASLSMTYILYPGYTGDVYDGGDLALINLSLVAPAGAESYSLYTGSSEVGQTYNVAGYGRTGEGGTGYTGASGSLRQGANRWDGTVADMVALGLNGISANSNILVSDFDNGLEANDAWDYFFDVYYPSTGDTEVSIAPGDSGGPSFIGGQVAGVSSFLLRLYTDTGASSDIDSTLNGSFGEFNAMTRVSSYSDWIYANDAAVPEPGSFVLAGLGLLALGWRRLRR